MRPRLLVVALLAVASAPLLAVISPLLLGFPVLLLVAILVTSQKARYAVTVFPEQRLICTSFQSGAPDECLIVSGSAKVRLYAGHRTWRYFVLVVADDYRPVYAFARRELTVLSTGSYKEAKRVAVALAADLAVPADLDPPMKRLMITVVVVVVIGGISLL